MCGIAGIANLSGGGVLLEELRRMCAAIEHRGPDDDGFYLARDVGLGMRRLSIIDLETGRQPVHNEDRSVWVVFNGEIYNFQELRSDLIAQGHAFYTGTDTEVIVHLYEQYGKACVEKLRGMFAFALWDERERKLLLARDRLGKKPLYYAMSRGRLIFASELKAILELPDIERKLNWYAVNHLFSYLVTPSDESIIEGVRKLEAGQRMIVSASGEPLIERYWDVRFEPDYSRSEESFAEELRARLEESVRLRMISDVPLGAFLSGGVDSSAVVAMMARLSPKPVKTFSIGFAETAFNELDYARKVARHFGTDHCELMLEPDALDVIEDIAWHLDEPFGDSSAIPTYMVSKLASEHVTVVLSGDGGDELFAGYDKYQVEGRERRYRFVPLPLRKMLGGVAACIPEGVRGGNFLRHMSLGGPARYLDASTLFRPRQKARLFQPDAWALIGRRAPRLVREDALRPGQARHWLSALQYFDIHNYLPLDILTKVDRMSMAHSIEARVPLLDHTLVEFAATIPPEMHLQRGMTKRVFKRAMDGILPAEILDRPKRGFEVPLERWFRGRLANFVFDLMGSEACRSRGIFNLDYVRFLVDQHQRGRNLYLQLWTMISFEMWCRTFLDNAGSRVERRREARRPAVAGVDPAAA